EQQESELRLDSLAAILTGGKAGPSIVRGKPDASLLIAAVRYVDENLQMPPDGKLAAAEIADLARWVEMGAPHPASSDAAAAQRDERPSSDSTFWAFQPPRR